MADRDIQYQISSLQRNNDNNNTHDNDNNNNNNKNNNDHLTLAPPRFVPVRGRTLALEQTPQGELRSCHIHDSCPSHSQLSRPRS